MRKKGAIKNFLGKIWNEKDLRYYVSFYLICFSIILLSTVYRICGERLFFSIRDFALSLAFYFLFLFGVEDLIKPTVNDLPVLEFGRYLPFDLSEVERKLDVYWETFFDMDTFGGYFSFLFDGLWYIMIYGTLLIPALCLLFYVIYDQYINKHIKQKEKKVKYKRNGKQKKRLTIKSLLSFLYMLGKQLYLRIVDFVDFLKSHKKIFRVLVLIWLINTNLLTICFGVFAWYFYWVASFDFLSIFTQIVKLVYDLVIMFWTLPGVFWAIILYVAFDLLRRYAAIKKLNHMEAKNRGFDNSLPVSTLICGTMGAGKTKTAVDMALSLQNEFRDRALELLDKNIMRFSEFNFMAFEKSLNDAIKKREIVNLATARSYIRQKRFEYGRRPNAERCWGYDMQKFKSTYNNGLQILDLWDCLENYAQEYFIYTMTTSLIISNLAIRSDLDPLDKGFFLSFNMDFFKRDPAKVEEYSAYSHIIDFDLFRIGCQMNKENAIAGSFEFGVIVISEIGKERQNMLELKEVKKNSSEANQRNDLFNSWLKTCRHAATVEGYSFIKFVSDEQRPESWGADARELCIVLNIREVSERKNSLLFSILPDFYMSVILPKYLKWYNKVKIYGNEAAGPVKKLHRVMCWMYSAFERKLNLFGYYKEKIIKETGTMDEPGEECKYYLMPKKIYAGRYSTDCYKDLFADRALEARTSLYEIDTYKTACATLEELSKQNSYFANDFIRMYRGNS